MSTPPLNESKPIALDAYETLAEPFSRIAEGKAENGYIEQPAMRQQLGAVKGLHVLDAGCGPGILSAYLTAQGATVTAFDVSPRMIMFAGKRLQGRADLHVADMAGPLPFLKTSSIDIVASSLAMDYVRDWSVPLGEFYRVLKSGGRLVFTVQHPVGAFLWYKLDGYAGVQYVEAMWKGFGLPVLVPDHYRCFAEMVNPLFAAGFSLRKVLDLKPVVALMDKNRDAYERFCKMPPFMCLEAVKG